MLGCNDEANMHPSSHAGGLSPMTGAIMQSQDLLKSRTWQFYLPLPNFSTVFLMTYTIAMTREIIAIASPIARIN